MSRIPLIPKSLKQAETLKQAIDFVCERREPKTKMVYTKDFRAFALEVMCDYVQGPVTTPEAATKLEYLFCDYEAGIESGSTSSAHNSGQNGQSPPLDTRPE